MTQLLLDRPAGLSRRLRLLLAVVGLGWIAPLVVAGCLTPSPSGLGTHQQLGLPPCSFRWLFGLRCPACGMTTSWSHAARGHWPASVRANAGGALLAVAALVLGPWTLVSAARGRWFLRAPDERVLLAATLSVVAVTLLDWVYRLAVG